MNLPDPPQFEVDTQKDDRKIFTAVALLGLLTSWGTLTQAERAAIGSMALALGTDVANRLR